MGKIFVRVTMIERKLDESVRENDRLIRIDFEM